MVVANLILIDLLCFIVHATEKEHLDLRRELEAQIRDKDEDCRKLQAQLTQLKSTR